MSAGTVQPPGFFPPPPGVIPNFTNPERKTSGIIPVSAVFLTISTVSLALRLYTKAVLIKIFGWEDVIITLAWLCNVGVTGSFLRGFNVAIGVHMWDLTVPAFEAFLKGAYATLPFYIVTVALAKVAILLFYLRLNPNKHFRYRVFAVLTITVAYMILLLMVQIFSCNPIRKFWDLSLAKTGHCLNIEGLYLATPIINTILDVLVLIIPIPMVMKLQVSWRYKLGLGVLFAVGSATVILSGIRIWSVAENNRLEDVTYVAATGCVLFVVETNLSVACGCIIMLRPFYRRCSLAISSALGLGREKSGGTSKRTPDLRAFDGTTVMGSHGEYRTKVSGYTGSKPSTNRSGGWPEWSWALNTKSRNEEAGEDEDLEGLNAELKQFAPIAHTHNRQDHSEKHYGHKHSGSTTKGDEESGNASLDGHINFAPGENSRLGGLSLEDGIVKTVSLDIR